MDSATGHYLLGNGYRAYNPVLMRFNRPDNLNPFGEGGLNAYAYCAGDPVNRSDPTGHIFLARRMLGIGRPKISRTPKAPVERAQKVWREEYNEPWATNRASKKFWELESAPEQSLFSRATDVISLNGVTNEMGVPPMIYDQLMDANGRFLALAKDKLQRAIKYDRRASEQLFNMAMSQPTPIEATRFIEHNARFKKARYDIARLNHYAMLAIRAGRQPGLRGGLSYLADNIRYLPRHPWYHRNGQERL